MLRRATLLPLALLLSLACDKSGESTGPEDASASAEAEGAPPAVAAPEAETAAAASAPEVCEQARARTLELGELDAQLAARDAPEDQKSMARARGAEINQAVDAKFVEVCLELDEDQLDCMAKLEGYADAMVPAKRGMLECRAKGGDGDDVCEEWFMRAEDAQAAYGSCRRVFDQVVGVAYEAGKPEQQAGIIGVMVQEDEPAGSQAGSGSGYGRGSGSGFGGRGKAVPKVRQAKATLSNSSLDKDIIRRIVRAHINEVRSCYNAGLTKDPTLAGQVVIEFTIAGSGKVSKSAAVDPDAFKDPAVPKCIAKAVKKWKFPKPQGGGEVNVSYPFNLDPG